MSFTDLLRQSRSKPVTALHKFLTNYDPNDRRRAYAFVEGTPDMVFYRAHMQRYVATASDLHVYSCEGKVGVYDAYLKIMARHPTCRRIVFIVDKDLDDIVSKAWPADPRIFVTDCYSVENYLVTREGFSGYIADYIKVRRIELTLVQLVEEFDRQLAVFQKRMLPIMAWIVVMRRAGHRVVLKDVDIGRFCCVSDSGTVRNSRRGMLSYLSRVCHTPNSPRIWRDVRKTCRELRRLEPKRYVRGKFEAWWFVEFVKRVIQQLVEVAGEAGGSVSVHASLSESNLVQTIGRAIATPTTLESFLEFHLRDNSGPHTVEQSRSTVLFRRVRHLFAGR